MSFSTPVNNATEAGWTGGISTGTAIIGSRGYVTVNQLGNFVRVSAAPVNPAVPAQFVDTDFMQSQNARSDFAVVPLTDTSVGLLWTDGLSRKTVFECLPPGADYFLACTDSLSSTLSAMRSSGLPG